MSNSPIDDSLFKKYGSQSKLVLSIYLKENKHSLKKMQTALKERDFEGVRLWAHKIKGASRVACAVHVEQWASQIEEHAPESNGKILKAEVQQLEEKFEEVVEFMEKQDKIRLMLVDDHKMIREAVKALYRSSENIDLVGFAKTGAEAIEMAGRLKPDVILMDIGLREMDGVEASESILQKCPELKILGFTARDDKENIERMKTAGAKGFVMKSVRFGKLTEAITEVSKGNEFWCEEGIYQG